MSQKYGRQGALQVNPLKAKGPQIQSVKVLAGGLLSAGVRTAYKLSKKKFPVGYGYPTEKAHSSINKLIKKAAEKTPKVEVSDYLPNQLKNIRANTPPNPNLSKIILRNDPSKIRK